MSTTVSYKGQTLTTVSNDTKTLLTEGKYLEDDLTLTDVSGGGSTLITKSISANGTYNASSDSADGYSQVNVAVPASAVDTGTKNITANGSNQDVVGYAAVDVAVPNSYSASDEGKVVSNGALVAQTAHADVTPTTSDQTIDTTLNNSLKVKGDADLVAGNIKKDVEIFGVTGSYEGGGGGGSGYNGTFTPASNQLLYEFYAPNCSNIAFGEVDTPDTTTGTPFLYSLFYASGKLYIVQTNNSGTSFAGGNSGPSVTVANDTITVNWAKAGGVKKPPQTGKTYAWVAW